MAKTVGQMKAAACRSIGEKPRSTWGLVLVQFYVSEPPVGAEALNQAAWTVPSLHDFHVSALLSETTQLNIAVGAFFEVSRPGSGEISLGGYTYY